MISETDNTSLPASNVVGGKELLFLFPMLGSSLAIIFDVGYFSGIGLHYFTFFSLSEHLVFALMYLPLGIILSTFLAAYVALIIRTKEPFRKRTRNLSTPFAVVTSVGMTLAGTVLLFVCYLIFGNLWGILTLSIATIVAAEVFHRSTTTKLIAGILVVTVSSFSLGHDFAIWKISPTIAMRYLAGQNSLTKLDTNENVTVVKIIRSGERGILFYDIEKKKMTYLNWDEVKKVTTSQLGE